MASPARSTAEEASRGKVSLDRVEKINTAWDDETFIAPELDARITKKLDRRLLPILFTMWLLAFIDRSNIGNARIDGLATDLKLDGTKFNVALSVFYVPYICVDIPSNWVLKKFGAGYYLPFLTGVFGLVSMCTGFVKTYSGLLVARFFLGLCEGGMLGGMIIYLAMFYPRHQLLVRITLFYAAAPLSGAVGGLLATGLAEINTTNYRGWPFIFFVEGAITIVAAAIAACYLPHTPSESRFLSSEETAAAEARMRNDGHGSSSTAESDKFSWHWVRRAILNWNTMLLSLDFFAIITPIYSFSLFLPTIISSLGYRRVQANLLTVPPNAAAIVTVLLVGRLSDRYRARGPFMLVGIALALVGYLMLIASPRPLVQYGGTFFVAAGIFPCSPLVMGWLANNLSPHLVRATGTGAQVMFANMSAFVATFTYIQTDAPRYITGHAINIGMLGLALACTVTCITYCSWENRTRERGGRDHRLSETDEGRRLGHGHPRYRYTI